ncbi:hypothetical protein ACWNYH_00580 [Candidatus Vidania fulgoroideorum]
MKSIKNKRKLTVLNNYVVLKTVKVVKKNKSKIFFKEEKNLKNSGKVIFCNKNNSKMIKVGDIVFFEKYSTANINVFGKKYVCVKISKIICKCSL